MRREDLSDLAAFLAVAEDKSFTRAAARLATSQSALSHTIRRLETRLGLRLLTRTTRSVAPTEAGERLLSTLRPALEEIDGKLASLTELREKPAGNVRITASDHAADTVLWPAIIRMRAEYPDIRFELSVENALVDIVAERFDAGVRLGEQLAKDMIAVPIGPPLRMVVIGSPSYFADRPAPLTPHDLADHACINLRMRTSGGFYVWEFEKAGREIKARIDGPLAFNTTRMCLKAALEGFGLAYLMEDHAAPYLADGRLIAVLREWSEPFAGYHLYYPSRRQPTPAFAAFVEALRYRDPA